jgi:hypothetical protein
MHAAAPMWRNGRCNGLKIAVLAISLLCPAYQTWDSLAGQIAPICDFRLFIRAGAKNGSLLHKF